jgi:hypothetical protein
MTDLELQQAKRITELEAELARVRQLRCQDISSNQGLMAQVAQLRGALELIAMPKRSDGTYNRSREACEVLAASALSELRKPIEVKP